MIQTLFAPYGDLADTLKHFLPSEGDGAHDISHLHRVWRNAQAIQEEEGGDLELLVASVLLHDCVQVLKDSSLRSKAARLAADKAAMALAELGWPEMRIGTVTAAIESHSYSAGLTPQSLEGRILQDADRLDAIGYVGIARCFYTSGRMNSSLYDMTEPQAVTRALNDRRFALDHFPSKLFKLTDGFQTETGARMARE